MENRKAGAGEGWFPVERLDVFWAAVDFLRLCDRLGRRLWLRNSALCRQLQRAAASLIANIGEGAACHTAGDRRRYFEYAYRSAGECSALLLSFHALDALTPDEYQEARALLARVHMMLRKLMSQAHRRP